MVSIVNRKVVNSDGTPAKAATLFGFFALLKNKETGEKMLGGEQVLQGYYMGNSQDAHRVAQMHQNTLSEQYPDANVVVQKGSLELVGPLVRDQMQGLLQEHRVEKMVCTYLAQCIAEMEADKSLEINPDLTMEMRLENVLKNARGFIASQVQSAFDQQQAKASGILGPDGQPIASGAEVVAEATAEVELTPEEIIDQELLKQQLRDQAGVGKVLAFPSRSEATEADFDAQDAAIDATGSVAVADIVAQEAGQLLPA